MTTDRVKQGKARVKDLAARLDAAIEPETADHQHEWEASVLATLVRSVNDDQGFDPAKLDRLDGFKYAILGSLTERDFQRSDHRAVFGAIRALNDKGEGVSESLVGERIKANEVAVPDQVLADIFSADPVQDANLLQTYLKRLALRGKVRSARAYVQSVMAALDGVDEDGALEDVVAHVQAAAFDLDRTKRLVQDAPTEAEVLDAFMDDLQRRVSDGGFVGLDSGFGHLNEVLNGLGQGLMIFAGPPSCGKTTFMKQVADQVAEKEGVPVLFFSFEQSAEELRIKTLARLSGVNSRAIMKGRAAGQADLRGIGPVSTWDQVEEAAKAYRTFGDRVRIIEADRSTTIGKIRIMGQAAKKRSGKDRVLIVVDYLQIVPVSNPRDYGTTKDRVDAICSDLRRLARDLDSPIIAISSENRAGYKNNTKPDMAVFKETGGIEFSADVGGAFWTDPNGPKDGNLRNVDLCILKNRNGELANIRLAFKADTATFTEQGKEDRRYTDSLEGESK